MLKKILPLLLMLFTLPLMVISQVTTSSLGGSVRNSKGDPLQGATITVTHVPTGTVYNSTTNAQGNYTIQNMAPGGPYSVTTTFVGYENQSEENIQLNLGQRFVLNVVMLDKNQSLQAVTVAAARAAVARAKGGTETNIGRDKMANLPTVGRNISDYLRYVPQAKITGDGGISLAGQNNRYNSFYIDGAANNDMFGLAASGTNGGQTGASPISIDAIDQFQVILSPYDVSLGNFTGGGINATTKSGTNDFRGSLYYFFRNQDLAGKTPGQDIDSLRKKLDPFKNRTMGFSLGGPIIKSKAFFFVNAEMQKDERPLPMTDTYGGVSGQAGLDNLIQKLQTTYNYNVGDYKNNMEKLDVNRIASKFDFNLSNRNKLTVSYRYTDAVRNNVSRSSRNSINFNSGGYEFNSTTHSASVELNTRFNNQTSNRLLITGTDVNDFRSPNSSPFPRVSIQDGSAFINFGSENFSVANALTQRTWALFDEFKWTKGRHTFSLGTDNDIYDASNIFVRDNYGNYTFNTLDAFLNDDPANVYTRSYSLVDGGKLGRDATNAAAAFKTLRLSFFVSDEFKVNDAFTLNYGVRATNVKYLDDPIADTFFNNIAVPKISQYYDLRGAQTGVIADPAWSIDPRIGFTYNVAEEKATIRGGIGLFTGRIPLVWPGGVYNNNGITVGGIRGTNVDFRADPLNQYSSTDFGIANPAPSGEINIVAKDFKMNKVMRTSLGLDKGLGNNWRLSMEGIYTKNINEIRYDRVDILPPSLRTTGVDVRNIYPLSGAFPTSIPITTSTTPVYTGVYLLSNNQGKKGYSFNFTTTIDKAWRNNWAVNANYSYGYSQVLNEGTSSQNSSQWRYMETVNGRNYLGLSTSDFDPKHRINMYAAKKFNYANGFLGTTISLVYNAQSGSPFSYVLGRGMIRDFDNNETNDLMYIPTAADIATMTFEAYTSSGVTYSAAQQKQMLEAYITGDKYLNKNRGEYASRNGARLPFTHNLDLKLQQDFNVKLNNRTIQLQLTYDIFNFTNFLNKDWGRQYFVSNDQANVLEVSGISVSGTNATPRYKFYQPRDNRVYSLSDGVFNSSRWTSQLGLRVNF